MPTIRRSTAVVNATGDGAATRLVTGEAEASKETLPQERKSGGCSANLTRRDDLG